MLLNNKIFPRPAVHILIEDNTPENIHELIFMKDSIIKYVHDITKYTLESQELYGKKKLFVLALQHNIVEYPGLYLDILDICKKHGMAGKDANLQAYKFSEIFLPSLEDKDLKKVFDKYKPYIECLFTENFTKGISLKSQTWKTVFGK